MECPLTRLKKVRETNEGVSAVLVRFGVLLVGTMVHTRDHPTQDDSRLPVHIFITALHFS